MGKMKLNEPGRQKPCKLECWKCIRNWLVSKKDGKVELKSRKEGRKNE